MKFSMRILPSRAGRMAGCVTVPSGRASWSCRATAVRSTSSGTTTGIAATTRSSQIGGTTPSRSRADSAVESAVLGTAIGALAGAAIGGNHRAQSAPERAV
jgi:hypothetical protein